MGEMTRNLAFLLTAFYQTRLVLIELSGNICPWRSDAEEDDGASVQRAHKYHISECLRQQNQTGFSTICFGELFSQRLVTIYDYSSDNQCSLVPHVCSGIIFIYLLWIFQTQPMCILKTGRRWRYIMRRCIQF